jgi:two-component system, NtrC family, response regulator AtoC
MNDPLDLCTSREMQSVRDLIAKVARTDVTVLLRGESGVGKELVARAIHASSARAQKPLLKVNCAALPGELLESELFGHEKGAFTGAYREKPGKFEVARGGTLLLDEIGEMPLRLQAKLLHILQDGEFARVGGERIIQTDVRVVAATNRDLEAGIRSAQFREDLYYRINVIEIRVPPLRERREEIPALVGHFLEHSKDENGHSVDLPAATLRAFMDYSWPGNVRELENVLKRIAVLGNAHQIPPEIVASLAKGLSLPEPAMSAVTPTAIPHVTMALKDIARQAARDAERAAITEVLERVHWNRAKAARLLQISYKAMLYKIVDCGLVKPAPDKELVVA